MVTVFALPSHAVACPRVKSRLDSLASHPPRRRGVVRTHDGCFFGIPYNATTILKMAADGEVSLFGSLPWSSVKWSSGVWSPVDGCICESSPVPPF